MSNRKWLPTFADLVDRMSIHQLKEVFVVEHKVRYSSEMRDLEHDLDILIRENNIKLTAKLIRSIILLAQMNEHIWYNESDARNGIEQDLQKLKLSHGLNGIRSRTMNLMKVLVGEFGRLDWKVDCLAAEFKDWRCSLLEDENE